MMERFLSKTDNIYLTKFIYYIYGWKKMKKKIVGIIVCMLLFATVLPVAGTMNFRKTNMGKQSIVDEEIVSNTGSDTNWWHMFRHDSGNTGYSSSVAPNTNNLRWKQETGEDIGFSSPVIVEDRLYISTGGFYAAEQLITSNIEKPSFLEELYPLSNMFEARDVLKEENSGNLRCLDAATGTPLWEFPIEEPNDPAVVDGKVYVTSFNLYAYNSIIYCLDAETGQNITWQHPIGGLALSPTIVADDEIYVSAIDLYSYSGTLYCFYAQNGTVKWAHTMPPYEFMYFSAPAVADGKVCFTTMDIYSYSGHLYCLDAETGQQSWPPKEVGISEFASPVIADGKVYAVGADIYSYSGDLYCFDVETGTPQWTYPMGYSQYSFSTPAVCEDGIYIAALDVPSYSSKIHHINMSGTMVWQVPISGFTYYNSPVVADGKLYIASEEGFFSCLDITDGGLLWNYTLNETISSPAIADERVYIADDFGTIYAFEDALKIGDISGGIINAKAEIKNIGDSEFTNVNWSISVVGGMLGLINITATGTITLEANSSKIVRALPVFGLGKIQVTVTTTMPGLNIIEKTREGFVLGPFVIIQS